MDPCCRSLKLCWLHLEYQLQIFGLIFFERLYVPIQSQNSFLPFSEIGMEWMVAHWKEQNILRYWSVPAAKPAAWCCDLLDNALKLSIKCLNEYKVFHWCFLGVKKWPPLPPQTLLKGDGHVVKDRNFSWLSCHSLWGMCKSGAHSDYSTGCFPVPDP